MYNFLYSGNVYYLLNDYQILSVVVVCHINLAYLK